MCEYKLLVTRDRIAIEYGKYEAFVDNHNEFTLLFDERDVTKKALTWCEITVIGDILVRVKNAISPNLVGKIKHQEGTDDEKLNSALAAIVGFLSELMQVNSN